MNNKNFSRIFNGVFILATVATLAVFGLGAWLGLAVIHWLGTH